MQSPQPKPKSTFPKIDVKTGQLQVRILKLLGYLSPVAQQLLGRLIGSGLWLLNTDMRKVTEINLALAYPKSQERWRRDLAKASLVETATTAIEFGSIWNRSPEVTRSRFHGVEGKALLDEAMASGKGVILVAPHLGNWEALNHFITQYYAITYLYQPPKHPEMDALIYRARTRNSAQAVPTTRRGIGQLARSLKQGGLIGILPDQEPERNTGGVWVPFFGVTALTATIVSKLIKNGATAIGAYCVREGTNFKIVFREMDRELYNSDLEISCTAMNRSIEQFIHEYPAQYQWEYKRFNTRPNLGDPKFYNPNRVQH